MGAKNIKVIVLDDTGMPMRAPKDLDPASTPAPATRARRRIRAARRRVAVGVGLSPMLSIALLLGCAGEEQLIPAARPAGGAALVEWLSDGSPCVTY